MPLRAFGAVSQTQLAVVKWLSAPAIPELCSTTDLEIPVPVLYGAPVHADSQHAIITVSVPNTVNNVSDLYIDVYTGVTYNQANPMHLNVVETYVDDAGGGGSFVHNVTLPVTANGTPLRIHIVSQYGALPLGRLYRVSQIIVEGLAAGGGHELTDLTVFSGAIQYV